MSMIGAAKRRIKDHLWTIALAAATGSLLCISFYMMVKAQILYGPAEALGLTPGALNMMATVFGLLGLVVGIPSLVTFMIGNIRKKY